MSETSLSKEFLRGLLENLAFIAQQSGKHGMDVAATDLVKADLPQILRVVESDLPLERIVQRSDLILHAEGPGVKADLPQLAAFTWLAHTADSALRKLSRSLFDLGDREAARLAKLLDFRVTGTAPGSLYMGLSLVDPEPDLLLVEDEPVMRRVREAIRGLPNAASAIGDEEMSGEIADLYPDPAERDVALSVLLKMAPTGKKGVHTVEMSSPGAGSSELGQRERVVLRAALRSPKLRQRREGSFLGEVRELDLDAGRFHLRDVSGIGSIRCVMHIDKARAKKVLGERVRVKGEYETNKAGKPRLMLVRDVEVIPEPLQGDLHAVF